MRIQPLKKNLSDNQKGRISSYGLFNGRLALGATLKVSSTTKEHQNRINRKLGIGGINGVTKSTEKTKGTIVNGNGKRQSLEQSSDSEDDSRTRLISKSSKKNDTTESQKKKKKKKQAIETNEHGSAEKDGARPPSSPPKAKIHPALLGSAQVASPKPHKSPTPQASPTISKKEVDRPAPSPTPASPVTSKDLPRLAEIPTAEPESPKLSREEKKRLKKKRSKEKKKLAKASIT